MPVPSDVLYFCVGCVHINFSQLRVQENDNSIEVVIKTSEIIMNQEKLWVCSCALS